MDPHPFLFFALAGLTGACALAVVVSQNIVRAAAWLLFALAGTAGVFFLLGADFVGTTQLLVYVGGTLVLVVFGVMLTAQGPFINLKISAVEWGIATVVGLLFYGLLAVCLLTRPLPSTLAAPLDAVQTTIKVDSASLFPALARQGSAEAQFPKDFLLVVEQEILRVVERVDDPGKKDDPSGLFKVVRGYQGTTAVAHPQGVAVMVERAPVTSAVIGEAFLGLDDTAPRANLPAARSPHPRTPMNYLLPFEIVSVHLLVVLIGAAYLARAKRRRGVTTP